MKTNIYAQPGGFMRNLILVLCLLIFSSFSYAAGGGEGGMRWSLRGYYGLASISPGDLNTIEKNGGLPTFSSDTLFGGGNGADTTVVSGTLININAEGGLGATIGGSFNVGGTGGLAILTGTLIPESTVLSVGQNGGSSAQGISSTIGGAGGASAAGGAGGQPAGPTENGGNGQIPGGGGGGGYTVVGNGGNGGSGRAIITVY